MHMNQAKYIYGIVFAMGGLGGIAGSLLPSYFAVTWGTPNLIYASVATLLALTIGFKYLMRYSSVHQEVAAQKPINNFWQGVEAIKNSKYLSFILFIVVLMQIVTTLIYYQFNIVLESSISAQDLRTAYCGKVMWIANTLTVGLQLFGSFLLVHFLGLKRSHLLLPIILSVNAFGSLFFPTFAMISAAFITIKAFDFSLFGVLKEMLYIPLKQEEKFKAKVIIDVFAYRSSKAVASLLILLLQTVGLVGIIHSLTVGSLLFLLLWTIIVYKMFRLKDETPEAVPAPLIEKAAETVSESKPD
jgi:ATP/ADP translocase